VITWHGEVVARMPGKRAYVHTSPTDWIDTGSPDNISYWCESEVDRIRAAGGTVIRITITGKAD